MAQRPERPRDSLPKRALGDDQRMRSIGLVTLGFIIGALFVIIVLIRACQWVF